MSSGPASPFVWLELLTRKRQPVSALDSITDREAWQPVAEVLIFQRASGTMAMIRNGLLPSISEAMSASAQTSSV